MKVPPELEKRILELADPRPAPSPAPAAKPRKVELVAPACRRTPGGAEWTIPTEVPSLSNLREWKRRSATAGRHRRAVSRALGKTLAVLAPIAGPYHEWGWHLHCRITRLGGKPLDFAANLPAALKYVEDGVCLLVGIDDSDPRWHCAFAQEPGPGLVGVLVELSVRPE